MSRNPRARMGLRNERPFETSFKFVALMVGSGND